MLGREIYRYLYRSSNKALPTPRHLSAAKVPDGENAIGAPLLR
jgi:hypothetical protein